MKIAEWMKTHKRKAMLTGVLLIVILAVSCGGAFLLLWKNKGMGEMMSWQSGMAGGFGTALGAVGEDAVTASGLTSVGMVQEVFEVEGVSDSLVVEEVYVSSEQEIVAGDKVLKLTQDSVAQVRKNLEKVLREADLAYRAGTIEYEQNKITAEYERDIAVLTGEWAEAVYKETVSSLSANVEQASERVEETKEQIAEYQSIVNEEGYDKAYGVSEYKVLYDENLELLTAKMEEWGASWSQVVSGVGMSSNSAGVSNGAQMPNDVQGLGDVQTSPGVTISGNAVSSGDASDGVAVSGSKTATSDQLMVLQSLYQVLEQNLSDYTQAKESYEDAVMNASLELQTLQLGLPAYEEALAQAKETYESNVLQARLTMEQSLASAKRAESDYETALEKAQSDYESLKDAKEEAEENLALFEQTVGDGYYYASADGEILRMMVREEQYLNSDASIFLYINPQEMTVSVSVNQSEIAAIEVGDDAYVMSENGSFRGSVTAINPISASDSRTNVTYSVTVTLTGDMTNLGTNETVTVAFTGGNNDEEEN